MRRWVGGVGVSEWPWYNGLGICTTPNLDTMTSFKLTNERKGGKRWLYNCMADYKDIKNSTKEEASRGQQTPRKGRSEKRKGSEGFRMRDNNHGLGNLRCCFTTSASHLWRHIHTLWSSTWDFNTCGGGGRVEMMGYL